jgi:hypothetical protein
MLDPERVRYFNPVVEDWGVEARQREEVEKGLSDFHLYVITPKMAGVYAVAEVAESAVRRPRGTILCVLHEDGLRVWDKGQAKSMEAVASLVSRNGATVFNDLASVASFLNGRKS